MSGTLVLVPALNVEALMDGRRGDPRDAFSYDMNRFYPGNRMDILPKKLLGHFYEVLPNMLIYIWQFIPAAIIQCFAALSLQSGELGIGKNTGT